MMPKAASKPKVEKPGRGLARPGDPLINGDGRKIEPMNKMGLTKKQEAQQGVIDPAKYRPTKRRIVKELPAEVSMINAVSVVFMYTLLGVGDREIANALRTSVEDIIQLREHSAYGECFQIIHGEFINANSDLLTSRIAAYSQDALTQVGELATGGKKEEVRLRASIDVLDRAGVRPKDQEQRGQMTQSHLRIIVVDGDTETNVKVEIGEE